MEAYTGFAEVYDLFMDNVPYDEWEAYLAGLLAEYGVTGGTVAELGCGTGIMTERMADRGYDMIGIDSSEDMLALAADRRLESGHDILYVLQDMRKLELAGCADAFYCICDSLNYITEREDLAEVFRRVRRYLSPGGVFIFDFNTPAEYRDPLREAPIVEEQEGVTMIWENEYDEESRINEHFLTFFIPDPGEPYDENTLYRKVEEIHVQRAWTVEGIRDALTEAGLTCAALYEAATRRAPDEDTHRIYCVAKRGNGGIIE